MSTRTRWTVSVAVIVAIFLLIAALLFLRFQGFPSQTSHL
jgi:ABC-type transporter Mla subunit MlaD